MDNFDETKISVKPIKLNQELLDNINRRFIQLKLKAQDPNEKAELLSELKSLVKQKYPNIKENYVKDSYLESILVWCQDRINKLNDLVDDSFSYLWTDMTSLSTDRLQLETTLKLIDTLEQHLQNVDSKLLENEGKLKNQLKSVYKSIKIEKNKDSSGKRPPNHWELTRLILTGSLEGPPVAELFRLLGKEAVVYRLQIARNVCNQQARSKNT